MQRWRLAADAAKSKTKMRAVKTASIHGVEFLSLSTVTWEQLLAKKEQLCQIPTTREELPKHG